MKLNKKVKKALIIGASAIAGILVLFIALGAAGVGNPQPTGTAAPATVQQKVQPEAATASPTTAPATPAAKPTTPKPAPKPTDKVVARYSGSGDTTTSPFTITGNGDWHLSYWFSCANWGQSGNFIVNEENTDGTSDFTGVQVNELSTGTSKDVASYVYGDAGDHALQIQSECDWAVAVVTGP